MSFRGVRLGAAIVAAVLVGCQKKEVANAPGATAQTPPPKPLAVEAVGANERSQHFAAVNKYLELGGTMYGFVDVDGDVLKLAGDAQRLLGEAAKSDPKARMFAKADVAEIARILGLTDVKALGVSSVQEGGGLFRNRMFLYTAGERHGLFAALGGAPAAFKHVGLAPADTAFFGETEVDVGVLYRAVKQVIEKVAGEPAGAQLEGVLKKAGDATAFSVLELIHGLKGRSAVIVRVDPEKTMRIGSGAQAVVVPAFSLVACVEGVGSILEGSFAKERSLQRNEAGTQHIYTPVRSPRMEGFEPALVVNGTTLFVTTSLPFYRECREQKTSLAQNAEFQRALGRVGHEGNGLTFVSPRFFARLREIETLNPKLPPQVQSVLALVLAQVPKTDQPLVSIRTNLDDGILVRSSWNRSLKQEIAAVSLYNPVTLGAVAAMAIPAFQKVRTASQEKAVLNNLRMLAAAADQHYLETGTTMATYDQLVGPTHYVKVLQPVAGENYRALRFEQGQPLRVRLADGKVIEYKP